MALKLISVNIERSKHLERVLPFIERERPDVLCVQELMERDIEAFARLLAPALFVPTTRHPAEGESGTMGLGVFSRLPIHKKSARYYHGDGLPSVEFDFSSAARKHETEAHAVALIECEQDSEAYTIATTHFTWTPDGNPDDYQRGDLQNLFRVLPEEGLVLCGDFNAPRGGEIFTALAARFTDNVPSEYTTSIDKDLHRAGDLQLMVDGLFTTPAYACTDVQLVKGVSDHMAIRATIEKVTVER